MKRALLAECHSERLLARVVRAFAGLASGTTGVVDAAFVWAPGTWTLTQCRFEW